MLMMAIIIVSTLLVGYHWGKHDGRAEGYNQGTADLSLSLREQSFEEGYCPLCNSSPTERSQCNDQKALVPTTFHEGFYG